MDRLASITTFTAVVTSGSLAAAARRLNLAPATVTTHLRGLEDRLGARLLNRNTRKLSLTEAGQAYFDQASLILAELDAVDASIAQLQSAPRGTLRVNTANLLSPVVAPLCAAFAKAFPDITLDVATSDRTPDLVTDGIDVAVRLARGAQSTLIARQLGSFRAICCAAPAYVSKHGVPRDPVELALHNCLCYAYPGHTGLAREWRLKGPLEEITVPVRASLRTNNIDLIRAAALDAQGIALAASFRIDDDLRAGRLVRVLPEHHGEGRMVALYPNRQHLPLKVRSFIDFAVKHLADDAVAHPRAEAHAGA